MWFKSLKDFKENSEAKALIFTIANYTIRIYDKQDDLDNINSRELFVDNWLAEEKPRLRVIEQLDNFQGGRYIYD